MHLLLHMIKYYLDGLREEMRGGVGKILGEDGRGLLWWRGRGGGLGGKGGRGISSWEWMGLYKYNKELKVNLNNI